MAKEDDRATVAGASRALVRRTALRPEIRTALALEDAGELQEAARVFEYAGEHAQAAALRLEYANSVRDEGERLDILREGCARNPGSTDEGRALHLSLAKALLIRAHVVAEGSAQRSLHLEAARALEEAGDFAGAGELYEQLGLLHQAATAFERGGEIAKLELVLEVLERREAEESAIADLEQQVDEALDRGQRRHAWMLLTEHVARRERFGRGPRPSLLRRLRFIEDRKPRADRIDLAWNDGRVTRIRTGRTFTIGRAPDAELTVPGPKLSRAHVQLSIEIEGTSAGIAATDLGSKLGTFWAGEALEPGQPRRLEHHGQLGLGLGATVDVHPRPGPSALVRTAADLGAPWSLFLPQGGSLALAPGIVVPARVLFDRGWVVLDLASGVAATLSSHPLTPGGSVELLVGDRIGLVDAPLRMEVLA